jgi:hypothetical protein
VRRFNHNTTLAVYQLKDRSIICGFVLQVVYTMQVFFGCNANSENILGGGLKFVPTKWLKRGFYVDQAYLSICRLFWKSSNE